MAGENIDNLTMEQYLTLTQGNQAPGMVRPKIEGNVSFEIKSHFMWGLRKDTFLRNKNDDAHEHIEWVLDITSLFNIPGVTRVQSCLMFFQSPSLEPQKGRWIDKPQEPLMLGISSKKAFIQRLGKESHGPILGMTPAEGLTAIQTMDGHSQRWHDSSPSQSLCDGPHLDKECPLNEDAKSVEEVKYGEGRSSPFNGTKYRVGQPRYYTRGASLKNLETQIKQLTKEVHAKAATEFLTSSVGQCKVVYDDAPINKASSKKANEIHEVSFIDKQEDDNLPSEDLGASINVMPKSMFEHLKLANVKETNMLVEMADMTKKFKRLDENKVWEICKSTRDRILKDHWKEKFGEDDDVTDEGWEYLEKCREEKTDAIFDTIFDKLDDSWFSEETQDEDDLDGIIDYLEPTSYDMFIDNEDEAYKERLCNLLGMPYRKPPLILIERVEVTRYNIGTGETYTKTKNLGIDEIPQTSTNVANVRAVLMNELGADGGTQGAT
uniref:Uncharacterized protein n=1 Tax=Tanacetum cinerariifolium TaxID=118510 RepID=A0A6L2KP69_TANCI|nr:hypothetical protein [Tanacetum cinerariifolium]